MAPPDPVGLELAPHTFQVDRAQLRLYAKAIGETRAEYLDDEAARRAGYRASPIPPAFVFTITMNPDNQYDLLEALNLPLESVLHGGQSFEYFAPICCGDLLRVERRVTGAYEKKGGALRFFDVEAEISLAQSGDLMCKAVETLVSRRSKP